MLLFETVEMVLHTFFWLNLGLLLFPRKLGFCRLSVALYILICYYKYPP